MKLKKIPELGQIHYLYLWVHPQWSCPLTIPGVDQEIRKYKKFRDRFLDSPHSGLVHVADSPRPEYAGDEIYNYFIGQLQQFDQATTQIVGNRYLRWSRGRFVSAKNPGDIAALVGHFNLEGKNQDFFVEERERWMTRKPKYLAKISVFGKARDSCPLGQATLWNLHSIASIVRYYSQETPERIIPPTTTKQFPGDGEATYVFER